LYHFANGKLNAKVAPPLSCKLFLAHILPPHPKPVPVKDFVANFVDNLGNMSKIKLTVMSYALTLKHKNPLNNVNSQYAKLLLRSLVMTAGKSLLMMVKYLTILFH
jgi:hypothetical protein